MGTLRERVGSHVKFCSYRLGSNHHHKKPDGQCNAAVVPGSAFCWVHQPGGKTRVIDRLSQEQKDLATEMYVGGAKARQVAHALGITSAQANTIRRYLDVPPLPDKPKKRRPLPPPRSVLPKKPQIRSRFKTRRPRLRSAMPTTMEQYIAFDGEVDGLSQRVAIMKTERGWVKMYAEIGYP